MVLHQPLRPGPHHRIFRHAITLLTGFLDLVIEERLVTVKYILEIVLTPEPQFYLTMLATGFDVDSLAIRHFERVAVSHEITTIVGHQPLTAATQKSSRAFVIRDEATDSRSRIGCTEYVDMTVWELGWKASSGH